MKFIAGRLGRLTAALLLSLTSLLTISMPLAHAAGPFTCTWTGLGDGVNFNDASNWDTTTPGADCNSGAPIAGNTYDLVFPDISSPDPAPSNNVPGLTLDSITFNGSTSAYDITGDAISLSGGITDTTGVQQEVDLDTTFTGSQSITFGSASDILMMDGALSGAGNVAVTGGGTWSVNGDASNYTGTITVNGGDFDVQNGGTYTLGGHLVINSGGSLLLDNFANANTTYNLPLTLSGNGNGHGTSAISSVGTPGFNQILAGPVTLASNVELDGMSGTVTITGALSGAFTITVGSGQAVSLAVDSSDNTSNTSNGNQAVNTVATPDTGLAAIQANLAMIIAVTVVAGSSLVLISRRVKVTA